MKNSSGVLVIIPVMNRPDAIIPTLEAVRKQKLPPVHLIVVDDGSTDHTPDVIRKWLADSALEFSTELIVLPSNKGASEARNTGLRQARGKYPYVYFLDSDDIPPPNFLEKTSSALKNRPDAVAVSSDRIIKDLSDHKTMTYKLQKIAKNPWLWFFNKGAGIASCTVFREEFVYKLGGYNEALPTGHDVELFMRIADLGSWLYVSDCPVTFCRLESRLSDIYPIKHTMWCFVFENSTLISTALKHIKPKVYRKGLAHRWRRAGQVMLEGHHYVEAVDCLRRSLAWRLYNKAVIDLFLCYLMLWRHKILRLPLLLAKDRSKPHNKKP